MQSRLAKQSDQLVEYFKSVESVTWCEDLKQTIYLGKNKNTKTLCSKTNKTILCEST